MQAIKMEKPGSYDVLKVVDIDMPIAKTGELLIEVKATAVNRTDIVTRENKNSIPEFSLSCIFCYLKPKSSFRLIHPDSKTKSLTYRRHIFLTSSRRISQPHPLFTLGFPWAPPSPLTTQFYEFSVSVHVSPVKQKTTTKN